MENAEKLLGCEQTHKKATCESHKHCLIGIFNLCSHWIFYRFEFLFVDLFRSMGLCYILLWVCVCVCVCVRFLLLCIFSSTGSDLTGPCSCHHLRLLHGFFTSNAQSNTITIFLYYFSKYTNTSFQVFF